MSNKTYYNALQKLTVYWVRPNGNQTSFPVMFALHLSASRKSGFSRVSQMDVGLGRTVLFL